MRHLAGRLGDHSPDPKDILVAILIGICVSAPVSVIVNVVLR